MPVLIGHYKKQEITSKLKKFSSTMQNALMMASAEYGDMTTWDYPTKQNDPDQINKFVYTYLYPYLAGIKECKAADGNCNDIIKNLYNGDAGPGKSAYVFIDGSCFGILIGGANDTSSFIHINYDYNCKNNPNEYDKDIFAFLIRIKKSSNTYKFKAGSANTFSLTNRNDLLDACKRHTEKGYEGGCSALIEFDGWEIKDDYPWLH